MAIDPTLIDTDQDQNQEAGGTGEDFSKLEAGGKLYDLNNFAQVNKIVKILEATRADIKTGKIHEYEGKSVKFGGGGRHALLVDQIVADIALKRLQGKNDLPFEQMKKIAEYKADMVAKIRKSQGKF